MLSKYFALHYALIVSYIQPFIDAFGTLMECCRCFVYKQVASVYLWALGKFFLGFVCLLVRKEGYFFSRKDSKAQRRTCSMRVCGSSHKELKGVSNPHKQCQCMTPRGSHVYSTIMSYKHPTPNGSNRNKPRLSTEDLYR